MKITKVKLYAYDLHKMKEFYSDHLGFTLIKNTDNYFEIAVGESIITFEKIPAFVNKQYHFALNIPCNLFQQAKSWVKEHTEILCSDGQDEVYFEILMAHSCYFYDAEENIIEFISRQEVNQKQDAEYFSPEHVLSIGEMNLTTDTIYSVANSLKEYGITPMKNSEISVDGLTFIGNYEDGANLLLGPSKRIWYFSDKKAIVSPIMIEIDKHLQLNMNEMGDFTVTQL
ncbi:VOC family protein [Lysinibacillus sp. NPDC097231]|uniref:VOC family protein n=1 Tax=Lysinibacillus sp. NPDC097231 TaxID=3364142 RepID=UPI00380A2C6B